MTSKFQFFGYKQALRLIPARSYIVRSFDADSGNWYGHEEILSTEKAVFDWLDTIDPRDGNFFQVLEQTTIDGKHDRTDDVTPDFETEYYRHLLSRGSLDDCEAGDIVSLNATDFDADTGEDFHAEQRLSYRTAAGPIQ